MKLDKFVVYKIPFVKNFFCRSGSPGHPGDYGRPVALYGPPLHGSQRDCDSPWRAPCWGTFSSCRPFFSCSSPWAAKRSCPLPEKSFERACYLRGARSGYKTPPHASEL